MRNKALLSGVSLTALVLVTFGAPPSPPATAPSTAPATQPKLATTAELGGAERFLSLLSTDKPIYRPSENVYIRDLILNAATHQPMGDQQAANAEFQIVGPKGDIVASGGAGSDKSVVAFNWTVPDSAAGGEYTLKISYPYQGYAPAERKFDVRVYRAPRLKNQIKFVREGYGPGDKVIATLHTERAEGGFPAGAKVTLTARVDDNQIFTAPAVIDAKGDCTATFELPKAMERGEGTLAFAIEDGGTVETAAKTIPILLQTLDIAFYPEGGDAVGGLPNHYYLEAKTPNKKPADIVGAIFDSENKKVADVKTEHEGRGRFQFSPDSPEAAPAQTYTLKITQPAGITKTWTLPAAKIGGAVLHTADDIVAAGQPVKVFVAAMDGGPYKLTLTRHEVEVAPPADVVLRGGAYGRADVELKPKPEADGVLTLTLWNGKNEPVAERLVFRQPAHQIHVQVTPDQSAYTPGGKPTLSILTTDDAGKPVSALVGLTVTDDSVLEMIDKREQAPRLPAMVFLEPEVRELADAQVYLDPANPKAALATDLLLGTQGWRRFALVNTKDFESKYGDDAARALALVKPAPPDIFFADAGAQEQLKNEAMPMVFGGAVPPALPAPMAMEHAIDKVAVEEKAAEIAPADIAPKDIKADALADRQLGFAQGKRLMPRQNQQVAIVRQYAHDLRPNWSPTERSDFTETVYWNAGIQTDATGKASATFALSDSVTAFRIFADGVDKTGALGASSSTLQSVQPFYIEPKIPLEVSAGDEIDLPVSARNNTSELLKNFKVTLDAASDLKINEPATNGGPDALAAGISTRKQFLITVGDKPGDVPLTIAASAGAFSDKVTRKLAIKPKGFPTQIAYGGLLDAQNPAKKDFEIPNSLVANSVETAITVYSSPMANLTDAVAALMREPCGCFEQTSSSNYPLAMAQQYFVNHQGVDPNLIAKSNELLAKGYERLIGFECKDKGYEWFGGATPGHEALTAYGIMEFRDMQNAQLSIVDPAMVDRTRTWLLGRRDGKGGFQRNAKSLDSFGGAPELTTNAYIVWALQQAGEKGLDTEISTVREAAKSSTDSYVLALAANICQLANDAESARAFMDKLSHKQNKGGAVDGAETSITRSGGEALAIETTSLASLAWMRDAKYAGNAQTAIKFLADSCKDGRFGSTQSTILALKAITAYDTANAHPKAAGQVVLLLDGKPEGEPIQFTADSKEPLRFSDLASELTPGKHSVSLQMTDGSQMPFSIAFNYNSVTPSSDDQCKLRLDTVLKDAQLAEGGITEAHVTVTNKSAKDAANPIAIIGIPGGLEVRHDQLKELVKSGKIDAYEVRGREVILYWRQLKAIAAADLSLSLTAAVPGTYSAPASRTYEYYTDEYKQWVEGTKVTITAK